MAFDTLFKNNNSHYISVNVTPMDIFSIIFCGYIGFLFHNEISAINIIFIYL
jgi:hypothetical protein